MRNKFTTKLAYPHLWRNAVAAWSPRLGSTGLTLRDRVGQSHGTLNNFAIASAWQPNRGAVGLNFDGVDDYVSLPFFPSSATCGVISMTLVNLAQNGGSCYFSYAQDSGFSNILEIEQDDSVGTLRFLVRVGGASVLDALSPTGFLTTNEVLNIAVVMQRMGGVQFWKNGVQYATTYRSGSSSSRYWLADITGANSAAIGRFATSPTRHPTCVIHDLRITGLIDPRLATSRYGIAYETKRSGKFKSSFNRRRRLLVGA